MKILGQMLVRAFTAPAPKRHDSHRKAREEAKRLAAICGCELEKCGTGWNVWPPKFDTRGQPHPGTLTDPFDGDHYAQDWAEALVMVRHYARKGRQ